MIWMPETNSYEGEPTNENGCVNWTKGAWVMTTEEARANLGRYNNDI